MPREIAVFDAYVPAVVLLFIAGAALTWVLDRVLAYSGVYRVVWHPSLFRASLLVCVCAACWVSPFIVDQSRIMTIRNIVGFIATAVVFIVAIVLGRALWVHYMDEPWTRDGRVRAEIVNIAPDVSGAVVELPVKDNQFVKKGDLLMQIDPSHYEIAVEEAQAAVAARKAELVMRRDDAQRRADMDALVVSKESRENATHTASAAEAGYQQALAALDAAKLNVARTRVVSPVDGYVTNLNVYRGDYATAGAAKLAIVDSHSFWVYGYFEETKLPRVRVGDQADIRLMSGGVLRGHVESISRGIYDRDNPESRDLVADVNPTFNWVRLAQRVPVRIRIDFVPDGVVLAAGVTCTVVLHG